jgi:eukaryotic-like serine/threonine-protein kinase
VRWDYNGARMALTSGMKLGPYEIQAPLGAGGMGEVYRARDTRLGRDVAIKVLAQHLSSSPELKARFEREARTISSLNHPHICHLYDIGSQEGIDYLVMEYVEGETLADRLLKGALLPEQLLKIGIEIAEALSTAHRAGIVHRDLKPGNIMLTNAGTKLMDFGLAKPAAAVLATTSPARSITPSTPTMSVAALASPASPVTQRGHLVGTFQYMSPEQLLGAEADARSDIFALGAVLYEMATRRRAFEGKSQLSVASAILEKEPEPLSRLQPRLPGALDHVVSTCLAKNPDGRWQSAADVARELAWVAHTTTAAPTMSVGRHNLVRRAAWAAGLLLMFSLALWQPWQTSPAPSVIRFPIIPPEKTTFGFGLAVSPDGHQVAFVAAQSNQTTLALRALDSTESKLVSGTGDAAFPFWSPDGNEIGFFAGGKLKKIDLRSGAVQSLADAYDGRGADWNRNGDIIFAPSPSSALFRISANGGNVIPVTVLDANKGETSHRWPHFLPDRNHFTFLVRSGVTKDAETIYIGSLNTHERQELFTASSGVEFAQPGYLMFVRSRTLFVQPFNEAKLRVTGEPIAVLDGLQPEGDSGPTYYAAFHVNGGVLAYRKGEGRLVQLAWWDQSGKKLKDASELGTYDEPALSPDGSRVALDVTGVHNSVWVLDLVRETLSRLSFEEVAVCPIWSPDGQQIVYRANEKKENALEYSIVARPSSGAGNATTLLSQSSRERGETFFPDAWSPDGEILILEGLDVTHGSHAALWLLPLKGDRKLQPFLSASFNQTHATFSPDGRWVAYSSDETGRSEVYAQDFPRRTKKVQISTGGGDQALWEHNGKELFYLSRDQNLMVVDVERRGGFKAGVPRVVFHAPIPYGGILGSRISYAISPDRKRILLNVVQEARAQQSATAVVNWSAEVRR